MNIIKLLKSHRTLKNSKIANNRGMTLIEIMIVIGIIAGISTALITNVMGSRAKAQMSQAKIKMSAIASALDLYNVDCGEYPEDLNDLMEAPSSCNSWGPEAYLKGKNVFKDPWNNDYIYERDGGDFELLSLGNDKREGGEGSDADIFYE